MRGLVLEGGASKGAYHIGAMRAFEEYNIHFDAVSGTSIGAINGAFYVAGQLDLLEETWLSMTNAWFYQVKKEKERNHTIEPFFYLGEKVLDGGLETDHLLQLLSTIDEEAFRRSPTDFCLVTVNKSKSENLVLYKKDIPEGKLAEYLLASSFLPVFKERTIDGAYFLDGCFYNNLPYKPLDDIGVDDFIAVRTYGFGRIRPWEFPKNRLVIWPSSFLGPSIDFSREKNQKIISLGYNDTREELEKKGWKR